jgi:hypothetical protein
MDSFRQRAVVRRSRYLCPKSAQVRMARAKFEWPPRIRKAAFIYLWRIMAAAYRPAFLIAVSFGRFKPAKSTDYESVFSNANRSLRRILDVSNSRAKKEKALSFEWCFQ